METDDEDPFAVPLPVSSSLKKRPQPPSRDDPQQQHQPRQPHGFYTPQTSRLVKPLPTAFHSTGGFLSRSGGLPAARRPPPPQTPLKGVLPSNGSSVASTPLSKNNSFFFPGVGPHPGETPSSATSSQWSTPLKKPPRKSHPPPPPLHHAIIHPFQHHATATASTINNNMTTDENENILSSPLQNRRMDMLSSSPQAPVDLHSEFSESLVATPKTRKKPSIENIGHLHSPYSQKHLALGDFDGIQQHPIQALTFQSSARSSPKRSPFLNSNTQNSCENNGHISKVPWSGSPGSAMNTNKRRARDHTRLLDLLTTPFPLFLTAESVRALKDGHYSELLGNTCNQLPNPHPTDATTTASNYFDTAFHVVSQIGEGAFGTVYRVRSWADGLEYAVKKTRAPFTGIKDALKKLEELEIQWSLTHHTPRSRHIVTLKGAWVQYGFLYMQMELCGGGSLQGFLDRECASRALEENKVWLILAQMALGLSDIHANGIVHLDLKPENVLLTADGALKIADFGLATLYPLLNPEEREGDRTYLAPEMWSGTGVGPPADIYSLGLMLLEITANILLPQNGPTWSQLRHGDLSAIDFGGASLPLVHLIQGMLVPDPTQRPTAKDILCHPLVQPLVVQ